MVEIPLHWLSLSLNLRKFVEDIISVYVGACEVLYTFSLHLQPRPLSTSFRDFSHQEIFSIICISACDLFWPIKCNRNDNGTSTKLVTQSHVTFALILENISAAIKPAADWYESNNTLPAVALPACSQNCLPKWQLVQIHKWAWHEQKYPVKTILISDCINLINLGMIFHSESNWYCMMSQEWTF